MFGTAVTRFLDGMRKKFAHTSLCAQFGFATRKIKLPYHTKKGKTFSCTSWLAFVSEAWENCVNRSVHGRRGVSA